MTYGLMSLFFFCFYRMLELQFVYKSFTGKSGYAQSVCVCATKKNGYSTSRVQHVKTKKKRKERRRSAHKHIHTHIYIHGEREKEGEKRSEQSNA